MPTAQVSALPMPDTILGCNITEGIGMERIGTVKTHAMLTGAVTPDVTQIGMVCTRTSAMGANRRATKAIGTSRQASEDTSKSHRAAKGNGTGHLVSEVTGRCHRATKGNGTGHRRASKGNGKLMVDDSKPTFHL